MVIELTGQPSPEIKNAAWCEYEDDIARASTSDFQGGPPATHRHKDKDREYTAGQHAPLAGSSENETVGRKNPSRGANCQV